MSAHRNELDQPVGEPLPSWTARPRPPHAVMQGRWCRLEPLDAARHAGALHEAYAADADGRNWTYLPYGPFASAQDYAAAVASVQNDRETLFYAVVEPHSGRPLGVASYLRIDPEMGSIEVGHLRYAPALQGTTMATEAMYLMMKHVFDELGYRRYEWKCDSLNGPSRAAAERLGFTYEGTFRQAAVYKSRNRDTSWYSITDAEWPAIKRALEGWLDAANFDSRGRQRRRLADFASPTAQA
jgi:RimJ/RimL family protein N-acetyltransferase